VWRDGHEPLGLGETIGMVMTERGLTVPAAGGSVLARWGDIIAAAAPELASRVAAQPPLSHSRDGTRAPGRLAAGERG
jgi:hypothetical protein